MTNRPTLFPPSDQFWVHCARHLIKSRQQGGYFCDEGETSPHDFSALRVIVPAYEHAQWLTRALIEQLGSHFIPPRMNTLSAWLDLHVPTSTKPVSEGERLMALYAQLREHGWLKKLFSARKNTDLLPLAQTLIKLSDELTQAMLPAIGDRENLQQTWQRSLAQLPMPAQQLLSDEAQLVWQIWQSQLDGKDAISIRLQRLLELAQGAPDPLIWISPVLPEGIDLQFLNAYQARQRTQIISLDWRKSALEPVFVQAWPELAEQDAVMFDESSDVAMPKKKITTIASDSIEQEAQLGAQTIVDWLASGKTSVALVAQDRVVARRIRALLERAGVHVADETGWKLSTTRAASALAAWFDVIVTRADTVVLLDFLKSPYFDPATMRAQPEKSSWVMQIESTLLRANVNGGWESISAALQKFPDCAVLCEQLKHQAANYSQRKTLSLWLALTRMSLTEFGVIARWQNDVAGLQMLQLLDGLQTDCAALPDRFSFAEWRGFINLQLEGTAFEGGKEDKRVVMLPLNGARLRRFDAVLMVGCDAAHLPSQPEEILFFTNAVRRECGLITREARSRQQLRDFTELLTTNPEIVLSWQYQQRAEDNPVSPWLQRLNLCLQQSGLPQIPKHQVRLTNQTLQTITPQQPRPSAPSLIPSTLSASAYNSFIACPYQFFATRMLGLSALDSLSDMPEKRDYGGWLHAILKTFHETLQAQPIETIAEQEQLLTTISSTLFDSVIETNPGALGYRKRWEKVIPAYVAWSHAYTQSGWQFEMGEIWLERNLEWEDGQVLLRGQIDRIDSHSDGQLAVLDYKTSKKGDLIKKLNQAEDQQLPFYGLLAETDSAKIEEANYVALELSYGKIDHASAPDYLAWQHELRGAIVDNLRAIARGAALPAQGTEHVCQYCDVRGLCRKGAW